MSYHEENDQVILTMSREDYKRLRLVSEANVGIGRPTFFEFLNRLHKGNPNYTPYQVEEEKS